jgi:hypothetical protein
MRTEIANFIRAAEQLAEMEPENAEDFDGMLTGLSVAWTKVGDATAEWAELLDAQLRIDPVVTRPLYEQADEAGAIGKAYMTSRANFRRIYQAHIEAMESKARPVAKPGFFEAA